MGCRFYKAWVGRCDKPTLVGSDFCHEHDGKKCLTHNQQAVAECDVTVGPFVCGNMRCPDCGIVCHYHR